MKMKPNTQHSVWRNEDIVFEQKWLPVPSAAVTSAMQSSIEAISLWVEVLETQVTLVSLVFPFNTPILCFELIG